MMWNLYEKEKSLEPLKFSNGKTQKDIVEETIKAVKSGTKIIFIKGVCGTGKSSIALNIAKEIGKASIIVPIKSLQKQYEEDYTNKKYLLKDNKKLKINLITGRANHKCPFFNELHFAEKNSTLDDFQKIKIDNSCDNELLPCKIAIKEKNFRIIRDYIKKNPKIKEIDANKATRMSIAPICPYWSPIVPVEIELNLDNFSRKIYSGLDNREFAIYKRQPGCGYYDQFDSYLSSDVIIFNSHKYLLENLMNRKPSTEIEIIDECDEFLDNLSNSKKINLNRLNFALGELLAGSEKSAEVINKLLLLIRSLLMDRRLNEYINKEEIIHLENSEIEKILNLLGSGFMDSVECDEENYCFNCIEIAKTFENMEEETFVSFSKEDKNIIARLVTINLEKRFAEIAEKNKVILMMSGTLHSENVLKNIFGISNFKIIEAETSLPGEISNQFTGMEMDCRYLNFQTGEITRKQYLTALEECIKKSKKPALVHVVSFKDLPSEQEAINYNLNIMTQEKLFKLQAKNKIGEDILDFKQKKIQVLYSTKCNRGVDFPGEICNSIILTKYPYPNVSSIFWKILRKNKPQFYNEFYMDKARREFLQRIYRGLRGKDDHVFLLSPDIRVFNRNKF